MSADAVTIPPPKIQTEEATKRDIAFDILKGISIVEVIIHHTLGFSISKFVEKFSSEWYAMQTARLVLHFAVPTFLMISALLLARSLSKLGKPNWSRFYIRRVQRTLMPYLLWTVFYLFVRTMPFAGNAPVVEGDFPLFGLIGIPETFTRADSMARVLFFGKAFYHLYFMAVLLQMSVIFPLIFYFVRKLHGNLFIWLLISALIQAIVYIVNWLWVRFPYPASTIFWFTPTILAGTYIGIHWNEWENIWRKWRVVFPIAAVVSLGFYLYFEFHVLHEQPVNSRFLNGAFISYCTFIALTLLGFSRWLAKKKYVSNFFASVGNRSIGLFLIHPAILELLRGPTVGKFLSSTPWPFLTTLLICFVTSWILVELFYLMRIGKFLFGRP